MDFPESWGIPDACPDCHAAWNGWISGPVNGLLGLRCTNDHDHQFQLDAAAELDAELTIHPWLYSKPSVYEGGALDGMAMPEPAALTLSVGETRQMGSDLYRLDRIEDDRVVFVVVLP